MSETEASEKIVKSKDSDCDKIKKDYESSNNDTNGIDNEGESISKQAKLVLNSNNSEILNSPPSNDSKTTTESIENITDSKPLKITVVYKKKDYSLDLISNQSVGDLKSLLHKETNIPPNLQKLCCKGNQLNDDTQSLENLKLKKFSKMILVATGVDEVLNVTTVDASKLVEPTASSKPSKEKLCKQTMHKKVLDKFGKPDDVMGGLRYGREPLPPVPLSGMYNKAGAKVRLNFKVDENVVVLSTKERTQKVQFGSITDVLSEAIEGHEEYHIMGFKIGTTELSRQWFYWVPAQYIEAIKDNLMGAWQTFPNF